MKQQSPLRKKQNYVQTGKVDFSRIHARMNKPTAAQLDAKRRASDCDCDDPSQCWEQCGELGHSEEHAVIAPKEPNPIREVAQGLIGGMGLGCAVVTLLTGFSGDNPLPFVAGTVVCLLAYMQLDK